MGPLTPGAGMSPQPSPDEEYWTYWYEVVEDAESLRQGDILRGIVAAVLENEPVDLDVEGDPEFPVEVFAPRDWIILTASCDLDARGATHALVAPVFEVTPEILRTGDSATNFQKRVEVLRKGLSPRQFLLSKHPPLEFPLSFAQFRDLAFLPTQHIRDQLGENRLRLKHPFRESFGNWVGDRMSAVGPEDHTTIPPNGKRIFPAHILDAIEAMEG